MMGYRMKVTEMRTWAERWTYNPSNFRKLKNNTYEWGDAAGMHYIGFFETPILIFSPNGSISIRMGGWSESPTTRNRINEYQKLVYLYQEKHVTWVRRISSAPVFIMGNDGQMRFVDKTGPVQFYEGMTVLPDAPLFDYCGNIA
jgi:hypothetical protein